MALAGLVGAACGIRLGRHIDAGFGRRAVVVAYGVGAAILLLRATSVGQPWLAVTAHALGELFWPPLGPTPGVVIYHLAKASPCRPALAAKDAGVLESAIPAALPRNGRDARSARHPRLALPRRRESGCNPPRTRRTVRLLGGWRTQQRGAPCVAPRPD